MLSTLPVLKAIGSNGIHLDAVRRLASDAEQAEEAALIREIFGPLTFAPSSWTPLDFPHC